MMCSKVERGGTPHNGVDVVGNAFKELKDPDLDRKF